MQSWIMNASQRTSQRYTHGEQREELLFEYYSFHSSEIGYLYP